MTPAEYIRRKEIYDIALSSAQVEAMSRQFREQAAWIVGQDEAYIIDAYYRVAAQIAEGRLSPAEARRAVRDVLRAAGYQADEPGSLRDMQDGTARQKLILDTNIKKAAGYAWHESVKGSLAFPAQELVRYGERRVPRDWETRWKVAWQGLPPEERAKALPGPRMVALTDCAIWSAISRWHDPYPPFDYNSGMDVEPVDYDEAAALGLVAADDEDERHEDVEEEAAVREFAPETRVMPQMSAAPDGMTGLLETWIAAVIGADAPVNSEQVTVNSGERFNAGDGPVKNRGVLESLLVRNAGPGGEDCEAESIETCRCEEKDSIYDYQKEIIRKRGLSDEEATRILERKRSSEEWQSLSTYQAQVRNLPPGIRENKNGHKATLTGQYKKKVLCNKAINKSNLNGYTDGEHVRAAADIDKIWNKASYLITEEAHDIREKGKMEYIRYHSSHKEGPNDIPVLITVKHPLDGTDDIFYSIELLP